MIHNKKIDIIITTFNSEKFVIRTLNSIVNQSYKNFKIIIIDDGSRDNTVQVIEEFFKQLDIEYIIVKNDNNGVSFSRNNGIDISDSELIYFIDSDDLLEENALECFVEQFNNEDIDLALCNYDYINEDGSRIKIFNNRKQLPIFAGRELVKLFIKSNIQISMGSFMVRRNIIGESIRFNTKYYNGEDQEFIIKLLLNSRYITYKDNIVFHYVNRIGSTVNSVNFNKFTVLNVIENLYEYFYELGEFNIARYLKYNKYQRECIFNIDYIIKNSNNSNKIYDYYIRNKLKRKLLLFRPMKLMDFKVVLKIIIMSLNFKLYYRIIKS